MHAAAGQPEAAEDAYRKSLAIKVRLGDEAGQASTLNQLGLLYDHILNRSEEAATFFRKAVDKSVDLAGEGRRRNNLADTLRKLGRFDEARQEVLRAIECKAGFGHASTPWTSWDILAQIETAAGNTTAAAEAKRKAIASYLAYRRDGGENHNPDGRICLAVTQRLLAGDPAAATSLLAERAADPNLPSHLRTFVQALQAIVAGSRDRMLADAPDLVYVMAAEILFLLEALNGPVSAGAYFKSGTGQQLSDWDAVNPRSKMLTMRIATGPVRTKISDPLCSSANSSHAAMLSLSHLPAARATKLEKNSNMEYDLQEHWG